MTAGELETQQELLRHAERQTAALESINTYLMRFLAVLAFVALVVIVLVLAN